MKICITGATSGLGYQLACSLAKKGHIVYVASKTEKERKHVEEKSKEDKVILFPIVFNLLQHGEENILTKLDLDVLFLHAGVGEGGNLETIQLDKMRENYEVNVFSNLEWIQRYIKDCKERHKKGKIFVTSSLLAHIPFPYLGSYGSSKASLSYCIKTLQRELSLQKANCQVTLVEPGAFHTGFNQVMLENQERNQKEVTAFDLKIRQLEQLLFVLMESFSYQSFVDKLVKEMQKEHPHRHIQMPLRQSILTKFYQLFAIFT